ncbi:KLD8A protein, partial [Polyodon spathula]|nr:KLD8A protein [Polyodon spathula]
RKPGGMAVAGTDKFRWQSLAPLPSGRVYHSLVEAGGQLFVVGGCDESGRPRSALELYCPEVDQWISLPPMPTPRAGAATAVLGKRLVVVGGMGLDQRPLKAVEVYNTDEGKWRKRSSLRAAAMGISMTVKDGRVIAAGGMGGDLYPQSLLQQYDLRKDVWVTLPRMPTPRYDTTTFVQGSKIYVLGGRQSKRSVVAFEAFDMESRSWAPLPSIPSRRAYSGLVLDEGGRLYCLGGLRQGGGHQRPKFTKNINIFDIQQGLWLKAERSLSMKTKRADFASGYLRGRVIVAGGLGNQPTVLGSVEAFLPGKKKWELLPSLPTPRCSASSIIFQDRLLVVGGVNQGPSCAAEALSVQEGEGP